MTPAISMASLCFEMKGRLLWAVSSNRFCVEVSAMPWQLETALSTLGVIVFKVFGVLQKKSGVTAKLLLVLRFGLVLCCG